MAIKNISFMLSTVVMILALSGCDWFGKDRKRETILDRVVSIPRLLVLDIPKLPPLCDEIVGLKKGFVEVQDGKIYYEQEGQGIPLVLINGGPGGTHHDFHPYFSQIKDFAHIIYYDQRGTGKSNRDDTGRTYTIKQAVEDLDSLRKALKIDRWAVLGWSYGGFLAQCYALTYPEHVTGLILVASETGFSNTRTKPELEQMIITQAERDAIRNIEKKCSEGKLTSTQVIYNNNLSGGWKRYSYYKPTTEETVRIALYGWDPAPGFEELMRPEIDKINLQGRFDDFEIPTLIIDAKWDLLLQDSGRTERMRKNYPHAQVEIFEKSGHKIFADETEKFFSILKSFLEKSNKMHIVYKPGNRLTWPKPLSELALKIYIANSLFNKTECEKLILAYYKQAVDENITDAGVWDALSTYFFRQRKHYEKCLYAMQQYETFEKIQNPEDFKQIGHCIKVWQGWMLDLLGRRNEAIKCYQEVLRNFKGICGHCIQIDKKWLEDHIKKPFTWGE